MADKLLRLQVESIDAIYGLVDAIRADAFQVARTGNNAARTRLRRTLLALKKTCEKARKEIPSVSRVHDWPPVGE